METWHPSPAVRSSNRSDPIAQMEWWRMGERRGKALENPSKGRGRHVEDYVLPHQSFAMSTIHYFLLFLHHNHHHHHHLHLLLLLLLHNNNNNKNGGGSFFFKKKKNSDEISEQQGGDTEKKWKRKKKKKTYDCAPSAMTRTPMAITAIHVAPAQLEALPVFLGALLQALVK